VNKVILDRYQGWMQMVGSQVKVEVKVEEKIVVMVHM
jgi:hypothetical protein